MQSISAVGHQYHIEFTNNASQTVPAYGVIKITGVQPDQTDGRPVLQASRPDAYGSQYLHFINGPASVKSGDNGFCADPAEGLLLALTAGQGCSSVSFSDPWGPIPNSFNLTRYSGGFQVIGSFSKTLILVKQLPMTWIEGYTTGISVNGMVTVEIWSGGQDSTYNVSASIPWGINLNANARVRCEVSSYANGVPQWEVTAAACS